MAPFHRLIANVEDNAEVFRHIRTLCMNVKNWDKCARTCPKDTSRSIILTSTNHWKKFCNVMRHPTKETKEYLNCEREHQHRVQKHCHYHAAKTYSISNFCRSLEKYKVCFERQKRYCSDAAMEIKETIDRAVENVFFKLLKLAGNKVRIPKKCFTRSHATRLKVVKEVPIYKSNIIQRQSYNQSQEVALTTTSTSTTSTTTTTPALCCEEDAEFFKETTTDDAYDNVQLSSLLKSSSKSCFFLFLFSLLFF